jgi:hypothetical protein
MSMTLSPAGRQAEADGKAALNALAAANRQRAFDERIQPQYSAEQRRQEQQQARQTADQLQRYIADLEARDRQGDWEARDNLETVRTAQALELRGRNAVLQELGWDISAAAAEYDADSGHRIMSAPDVKTWAAELRAAKQRHDTPMQSAFTNTALELGYVPREV